MDTDEAKIKGWLDELAARRCECEVINSQKQAAIEAILTPEIRDAIDRIDTEFTQREAQCWAVSFGLEENIKLGVAALGASVKGSTLHAVYSQGRMKFHRVRRPSVSIREAKS